MTRPLAIDLFCGLGGWTEGLLAEGWDVIGFDIERHKYGSHRYPAQLVLQDVRSIDGAQLAGASLIVSSPPCQEFSYRAMPWRRAKALGPPVLGLELFEQAFRIQHEAIRATGHLIPMVQENVRGANPWVERTHGRSRWNYGSYYLWGDVPALMPSGTGQNLDSRKQPGISGPRDNGKGDRWFQDGAAASGSKSSARKAASARIAMIPLALARHVARTYFPR